MGDGEIGMRGVLVLPTVREEQGSVITPFLTDVRTIALVLTLKHRVAQVSLRDLQDKFIFRKYNTILI